MKLILIIAAIVGFVLAIVGVFADWQITTDLGFIAAGLAAWAASTVAPADFPR